MAFAILARDFSAAANPRPKSGAGRDFDALANWGQLFYFELKRTYCELRTNSVRSPDFAGGG
jgi:hypothetical protein